MDNQHLLIIGQGDIGHAVSNTLVGSGHDVTGVARRARQHYDLQDNVGFIQADALTLNAEQLASFTRIAIIVAPDDYSTKGYEQSYLAICQHLAFLKDNLEQLERVVFISSTGVYGQDSGEWIDEDTVPVTPTRAASQVIRQAEQVLQHTFSDKAIIIRPSGIYGPERLMRLRQVQDDKPVAAEHWSNRIMDRDLVTIIAKVMTVDAALKPIYIATDFLPVTTLELTTWLSAQIGAPPPTVDSDKLTVTGKRLHSNIPLAWLAYPDWQTGYRDILAQRNL